MTPLIGARRTGVWLGALTLAFGVAGAGVARADDGVSLWRFLAPNEAAVDQLNDAGADLAENTIAGPDGKVYFDAVVTPQQKADYQAMGDEPIGVMQDEATAEANQRDRNATLAQIADSYANLKAGKDTKRASATADTVQAQRADYFTNYAGRYVSIEAWTSHGTTTGSRYSGPTLTASWLDANGNVLGSGQLQPFVDDNIYQYHTTLFRVGAVGDGGVMPTSVRFASSDGGTDTLPVKQWTSDAGSGQYPNGFQKDFITHYVDPQEAYSTIDQLAQQYPNIASIINVPNKSPGYQRLSQAIVGTATPYNPQMTSLTSAGSVATADRPKAVVVTSKLMGQNGGNTESITITNPNGAAGQPMSVSVSGNDITVNPATDGTGAIISTAAQVVTAINATPAAAALVTATTYGTTNGTGVVSPTVKTMLSDFLKAPASYPRGPQQPQILKIGTDTGNNKTGIFIYCQEHAREWVAPLVCLETAQRLVKNYGTDPETTNLVNNLDIYILPVVNPDGAAYSMYDYNLQRKNMVDYCPASTGDPTQRNGWGVDLNRNFSVGSLFDGYSGASTSCTNETYAGPSELSEPEVRNETWFQANYPNVKFDMNIHSYGGYFMWPPGAYKTAGRVPLPYPSYGTQQYFQQTADTVLDRIKSYRGTAILPSQTGPVIDVLYSAAGNSADEAYYNHNIIGYDFEVGADRFSSATGVCSTSSTAITESNCLQAVNFQPPFASEGHDEAMEFANGNYALLESALAYQNDTTAPTVTPVGPDISATPFSVTFNQSEAADIHYTTDGSAPTTSSPVYAPPRPRALPTPIPINGTTTLRWMATDIKGNTSTGSKTFYIGMQVSSSPSGSVPATLALSLGTPASFGSFTPGLTKDYTANMTANIVSTAGNGTLSVSDPDTAATGHLVNGSFVLPTVLQASATSPGGTGLPLANVGGSAAPTNIEMWSAPVSNDPVTVSFAQHIGSTDALRTGSYSKTLTFTLSTTQP